MAQNFSNLNRDLIGRSLSIKGVEIIDQDRNISHVKDAKISSLLVRTDAHIKGDVIIDGCTKTKSTCDPTEYDYIICGGGSAAALIARYLSDFGAVTPGESKSVLVLESGPNKLLEHTSTYGYSLPISIANDPDINTPHYLNPILNDPNQSNGVTSAFLSNNNYYSKNYPTISNASASTFTFVGGITDNVLTVTSTNGILVPGCLIEGNGVFENTQILRSLVPNPVFFASGSGSVVTYNCANSFTAGQKVVISGINPSAYNLGTATSPVTIASANAAQFTVSNAATGTYVAGGSALLCVGTSISSVTSNAVAISNIVANGTTITYTASGHTFVAGQSVAITGNTPSAYNFGHCVISSVVPGVSFTLTSTISVGAFVSGGNAGSAVTYTTSSPHGLLPLQTVSVTQVTSVTAYNVLNQVVATTPTPTTFTLFPSGTVTIGTGTGGVVSLVSGGAGVYKINTSQNILGPVTFTTGKRFISYTTGLGWGGGGNHYFQNAYKSTPFVCDSWATSCNNSQWTYSNLLPLFKSIETYNAYPGDNPNTLNERGREGQMTVIQLASTAQLAADTAIPLLAQSFGVPLIDDQNVSTGSVGIGPMQILSKLPYYMNPGTSATSPQVLTGSYRVFSFDAYLKLGTIIDQNGNGLNGRKLKVTQDTTVSRVLFTGTKATGVEWFNNFTKEKFEAHAKTKILICCAPMGSVPILQRSGVGPAALLNSLNIPVIVDSPMVGRNVTNHYNGQFPIASAAANAANILNPSGRIATLTDLRGLIGENPGSQFYYPSDGIRRAFSPSRNNTTSTLQLGNGIGTISNKNGKIEIRNTDAFDNPNVDWAIFSDDLTGSVNYLSTASGAVTALVATGTQVTYTAAGHPFSVGMDIFVTGVSQAFNLTHAPIIGTTANTFTVSYITPVASLGGLSGTAFRNGSDINKQMTFHKLARQAFTNAGLSMSNPPASAFVNDATLAQYCVNNAGLQSHAFGGCSFGTSINTGVIDGNLDVFGTTNLMVADSSVFTEVPDANPMLSVLVIAAKACELLGVSI